jgi:hypothetical protein
LLSYGKLSKKPSHFRSFTGLDVSEFDSLYRKIETEYERSETERLSRPDRKRKIGGGGKFALSLKDRLLMLLVYYRLYVTYTLAGYLFNLDQSNVCRDVNYIEPLVRMCVPIPKKIHNLTRRLRTLEEVKEYYPELRAFIDATEQEIPRPKKDKEKRKTHYSGKKRRHTVKTQLTVNSNGLITHRTNHSRGRRHDYDIFKRTHPYLPKGVVPFVDLGYDGIKSDFPEMKPMIPFKKRGHGRGHGGERAQELTPSQKRFNKKLSRARVVVEHTISRVKKFNIFGQEFRNRLKRYDAMTDIVSGLVNLRILGSNKSLLL